jgi:Abnormal spindle-like microcephaly-assoc'd, ASPM-SPD-2-Hydin
MNRRKNLWAAALVMAGIAGMLGCQGFSSKQQGQQQQQSGELTPASASISFGDVQAGSSATLGGSVTNTGQASVTISQVAASGTGFSVSGMTPPVTLAVGGSASFSVTFAPASAGSLSGSVAIASNAANSTLTISLSGSGVEQQTQSSLTVSSPIVVGNVVEGLSGTQTGTLTASGASVQVSSVTVDGTNPTEFAISGLTFPVTVTTSQPVNFTVTFTPAAVGAASATASFASNASNSPAAASVSGTGEGAPVHSVQLNWDASQTQNITSYNVYRAVYESSCGSYSNIGSTSSSPPLQYTDNSVADGTTYCYATTAVDAEGESAYSNVVEATIPPP